MSNNINTKKNEGGEQLEELVDKTKRNMKKGIAKIGLAVFKAKEHTTIKIVELKIKQRQISYKEEREILVENGASREELKDCEQRCNDDIAKLQESIENHHDKIDEKKVKTKEKINSLKSNPDPSPVSSPSSPSPKKPTSSSSVGGSPTSKSRPRNKNMSPTRPRGTTNTNSTPQNTNRNSRPDDPNQARRRVSRSSSPKPRNNNNPNSRPRERVGGGGAAPSGTRRARSTTPTRHARAAREPAGTTTRNPVRQQSPKRSNDGGPTSPKQRNVKPSAAPTPIPSSYNGPPPLPSFPNNELPPKARDMYTDIMSFRGKRCHNSTTVKPLLPGRGMGCADNVSKLKLISDTGSVDPNDIAQGAVSNCWLLASISALAEFDGAIQHLFRKTKKLHQRPLQGPNMYTITLWDLPTWMEVDIRVDERLCNGAVVAKTNPGHVVLGAKPTKRGELWVCYLEKALVGHCGGWDPLEIGIPTHAWAILTGCKDQYIIQPNPATGQFYCSAKFNPIQGSFVPHTNEPLVRDAGLFRVPWPEVGGPGLGGGGGSGKGGGRGGGSGGGGGMQSQEQMMMQLMSSGGMQAMMAGGKVGANSGPGGMAGVQQMMANGGGPGGGIGGIGELKEQDVFVQMCAWYKAHYIVAAGTKGTSDSNTTGGTIDNHAYSVLCSLQNVAGCKGIDLIQVRNPWGKGGTITNGQFGNSSRAPGWNKYPQVRQKLQPTLTNDDGTFWVTKQEFFKYFATVYVCATDMKQWVASARET